jgi:hypothetical protein
MSDSNPKPELEIKSDSDWKQRVKQESAQLDAKLQDEATSQSGPAGNAGGAAGTAPSAGASGEAGDAAAGERGAAVHSGQTLPPADFIMLVTMFSTQAMVSLGVLPSPETGRPEQNLELAKHFIDLLGVLQEKTRRNLTGHEADLLEGSLHELHMAYLELSQGAPEGSGD